MEIYNNDGKSYGRRTSSCSYCRNPEHNATNCPRVAEDYAYFTLPEPVIPLGSKTLKTNRWFGTPRYWGEWYEKCLGANERQLIAKAKASRSPTGVARSAPKCGFCGSKDHNRRNCSTMTDYVDRAHKANQNWRRAFYKKFVDELGISEGALLTLGVKQGYNEPLKEAMGIVTSVNWDELSLFCSTTSNGNRYCYRNADYVQNLMVECQVGNEKQTVTFDNEEIAAGSGTADKLIVKHSAGRHSWKSHQFVSVLSPSETPIGEEWIEEGHRKSLEFLVKKRSLEKLDSEGVTALIDLWA